jgi:ATP-binding cassette subfamily B protein
MKENSRQTIRFYIKHLKKLKFLAVLIVISIILAVLFGMVRPFLYKDLINIMVEADARRDVVFSLIMILIFIVGVDLFESIFWRVGTYMSCNLQPKIMSEILNECFERLHKHSYNFFNSNFMGSLVKKVNRMAFAFEALTDMMIFDFIPIIITVTVSIGVLFYLSPILGIILLVWLIVFSIVNYFLSIYKLKKYDLKRTKADTKVTGALADAITNNMNIKLFSNNAYEVRKFKRVTNHWFKKTKAAWYFNNHIELVQALLMIVLNFVVLYFAIGLWAEGVLSVGHFALIQLYLIELFMRTWDIGRIMRRAYERIADADEMTEILQTPYEVKNVRGAKRIDIRHGKIEFKNVKFSYEGDSGVIRDLSLKINPSEKMALIGPSGGGKSTVIRLILRLFELDGGQVLIDGQDISQMTQNSLRSQIALVPQNPILFHRTLAENIKYGCLNASDREVKAAAKMAHCDEFISKFSQGYNTFVGERGVKLSGGERQRIAIARAILNNTKILILDEATSNLDSESEKLIQDALKNLMKNKTTLVIAHRLSTIVSMDKIMVLDNGEIVEEGSHKTLINNKDSLYKKLWDLQVGGYLK